MAIEVEQLKIIIDTIVNLDDQLDELARGLREVAAAQALVDENFRIRVNVSGENELTRLQGQMAALSGQQVATAATGGASVPSGGGIDRGRGLATSGGFPTSIERVLQRTNLRMSDFHNLVARLLPLLLTFVGALPATITALGTLAGAALAASAALGAIGGLGLLALASQRGGGDIGAGLKEIWEEIREGFLEAFMPLARSFDDVMEDALDGVQEFFDELAARGEVLVQLKAEARAFGQFLLDFLPDAIAKLGLLADAFTPIFASLAEWIRATDIIGAFVEVTADALGPLKAASAAIVRMLPTIADLSVGFLHVASAILAIFDGMGKLLSVLPVTSEQFGILIGSVMSLVTALAIAASLEALFANTLITRVVAAIHTASVAIVEFIASMAGFEAAVLSGSVAIQILSAAVTALLTVTGLILLTGLMGVLINQFDVFGANVDDATASLRRFRGESARLSGMGGPTSGGLSRGAMTGSAPMAQTHVEDNSTTVYNVNEGGTEAVRRAQRKKSWVDKLLSSTPF